MTGEFVEKYSVFFLPDAANLMVVVVAVRGLEHALDFEQWHDVEAMVDADEVHDHVYFELLAPSVGHLAMVAIDLLDTEITRRKQRPLTYYAF